MLGNINCIAYYNNNSGVNHILRIFKIFLLLKVYVVFMRFENISTYFVSMSFVTNALFTTWFILCCILICIYVTHRVNVNISISLRLEIWWKIYLVIIYKVCIVHHIHLWIMCASFQTIHSKFNVIHVFVIIVIIPLMLMRETVTPKDEEAQLCFFSFTHCIPWNYRETRRTSYISHIKQLGMLYIVQSPKISLLIKMREILWTHLLLISISHESWPSIDTGSIMILKVAIMSSK